MSSIKIAVQNQFIGLTDQQVQAVVDALQIQVHEHFAPAWGIDAEITFYPKGALPSGAWQLIILDNSDQAGALGYHDLTSEGLPLGKVFAGTDLKFGTSWSVTASHELLEMLGDPDINLTVFVENKAGTGVLYAYENCDACEDDSFAYLINGIKVSDFVFPSWFQKFHLPGTQFDYGKHITQPFELLKGGYIGVYDIESGSGWQQKYPADQVLKYSMRAHIGSRRERRKTPKSQWLKSSANVVSSPKLKYVRAIMGDEGGFKPITFIVKFFDGRGGICFFDFQGSMGSGRCINSDDGDTQSFTVNQVLGDQSIVVTGNAPNGGKITVEVRDAHGTVLSSANDNTFDQNIIDSFIKSYTVS
ncbi:hypothetical protein SAMN05192574_101349 [Mucilaginibacter gossypiicola]|uniref:Uncharacterized protein n=1 Tax=Mucilaginibacter gossypiicola TaxID=551995 RepID=A0A1H8A696_9SPHI|nr:hypothetical protein [Mucilaginibacter gossypiicola]SEM65444.1 hypothetical protein SAMN05192574_101349 [Mucilaginibacter gossypiicola]